MGAPVFDSFGGITLVAGSFAPAGVADPAVTQNVGRFVVTREGVNTYKVQLGTATKKDVFSRCIDANFKAVVDAVTAGDSTITAVYSDPDVIVTGPTVPAAAVAHIKGASGSLMNMAASTIDLVVLNANGDALAELDAGSDGSRVHFTILLQGISHEEDV